MQIYLFSTTYFCIMSLILNIDTATEIARISIAQNGVVLKDAVNTEQKDHAAFVQPAIKMILANTGIALSAIDAIAVMAGPGSYTGLRVGMASAKGLCYALKKPLIAINTLEAMAMAALIVLPVTENKLLCPMIDARRMEVFTAIYNQSLEILLSPRALILEATGYEEFLEKNQIIFFGNGSGKWEKICTSTNATFQCINIDSASMALLSFKKFTANSFKTDDIAYLEPFYIKEFYDK
jgi:tRNA threonylcarbamoyladenosine biosynthesis protein TsaB